MSHRHRLSALGCAALLSGAVGVAQAAQVASPSPKADLDAALAAARKSAIPGPRVIPLSGEAQLFLPSGEVFVPAADADRIMVALGNSASPQRAGLIFGTTQSDWMVDVRWINEGYVRDSDAKDWSADALLESIRKNTAQDNAQREARGIRPIDVVGWVQPPAYDTRTHRLIWSLALHEKGAPADQPQTINYNTYALGRDGYFSLVLITPSDHIGADRIVAQTLLNALTFGPGRRYDDFHPSTDKVAAYGLAALVGAVAVKKLGLLALAGAFLLKVWKLGLFALAAGAAAVRKLFRRRPALGPPA